MTLALWVLVCPFLALLLGYTLFIQHERGGLWVVFKLFAIPAYPLDLLLNYTLTSVYLWDKRQPGEYTISQRLARLKHRTDWRGSIARTIANLLNYLAPSGKHV